MKIKITIFALVFSGLMVGWALYKKAPPAGAHSVAFVIDTPVTPVEAMEYRDSANRELHKAVIQLKNEKPAHPKTVTVTKTVTKVVQPKSVRVYYRVNGEVVSENVLTKEGDFYFLDLDSVLPEVLPEPDPVSAIQVNETDFKLDTPVKKKWWHFIK